MKRVCIFGIIVFLLLFSSAHATVCYQETPNVATACGGLSTGSYYNNVSSKFGNSGNIFDGDWSTSGSISSGITQYSMILINYTMPEYTRNVTYQYRANFPTGEIYTNSTLDACLNYSRAQGLIQTKFEVAANIMNLSCFADSDWKTIESEIGAPTFNNIYEEGIYWNINPNNVTITSSNGFNFLEGVSNTISCSSLDGTPTLYVNDVVVSNPFTFKPVDGSYNVRCVSPDTENFATVTENRTISVITNGFGCTDNTTYAFSRIYAPTSNFTTYNFTTLVENNLVKEDLSDVYLDLPATINFTDGYYLNVNTTNVSSFTLYFSNYYASNDYTVGSKSSNVTNIESYSNINPYYVLTFIDEMNGQEKLPPNATTTLSILCSHGQSSINLNDTNILLSSFEELDEIKTTVSYSATEIYSRNIHIDDEVEYRYIYLADATEYQVVQLLLEIVDGTGEFQNSDLIVKKNIDGSQQVITENSFDMASKVLVYLLNGEKYNIYVDNGDDIRSIGYLYVDTVDLTKTIYIGDVYAANNSYTNFSYSLDVVNNDTITFSYVDHVSATISVDFYVYNESDDSLLYLASTTNHSIVNFIYTMPDLNYTYKTDVKIHHEFYGENTIEISRLFEFINKIPTPWVSDEWAKRYATYILFFISMMFGAYFATTGAIIVSVIAIFFTIFEWIDIPAPILIVCLSMSILLKMTEGRRTD